MWSWGICLSITSQPLPPTHIHQFSCSFPPHYVHGIHSNHLGAVLFDSRQWTWNSKSYLCLGCHPRWWHPIPLWFLPRGLCMGLGQAHLVGVLSVSETEAVLTFWSTSEMVAMMHLFGMAMAWHHDPIRLCIHPPTSTQVREYVAARGRNPSGNPCTDPGWRGGVPVSSTVPNPKGAPPQLHMAIRDPNFSQLSNGKHLVGGSKKGRGSTSNGVTFGPVMGPCWMSWCQLRRWGSHPSRGEGMGI